MKNAIIIADYGANSGAGHLMRCGSLAKNLAEKLEVKFASKDKEYFKRLKNFASKIGCGAEFYEDLAGVGAKESASVVVIDSYKATTKFITDIKNHFDICVVIDDNAKLPFYDADFIVNQNIGAERFRYKARKDTKLLLGTDYIMMRDDFEKVEAINITNEVSDIVVTMGGADAKNVTEKVLVMLEKRKQFAFHVVVGDNFKNKASLEEYRKKSENIILHHNADIPKLFSTCQGAVSACGSTIYELASIGVPTIGIITAENQKNASIEMENAGIILSAGLSDKLYEEYFDRLFDDLMLNSDIRAKMHEKQLSMIKKDGAKKVAEMILARVNEV